VPVCEAIAAAQPLLTRVPMSSPETPKPETSTSRLPALAVRFSAVLLMTAIALGCGGGSSGNPLGPRGAAGSGMGAGMGGMGGGMGMSLESEFDYLAQMIPHHVEAIEAAQVLARGTSREAMRQFAQTIIETQTAEVRQMERWLAAWYAGRDPRVAYQPMMRDLSGLTGDALDRAFLVDMIPHHRMAVMMSQQLIVSGLAAHPEVVPFAANIRDVQHAEIQMMVAWLAQWFGASPG
jgi:uncharacterized protein (DUF305 family)